MNGSPWFKLLLGFLLSLFIGAGGWLVASLTTVQRDMHDSRERIVRLETQYDAIRQELQRVNAKLDELLNRPHDR